MIEVRSLAAAIACAALSLFASCASSAPMEKSVDYSSERSVLHEVTQIRSLIAEKPLEALARARTLKERSGDLQPVAELYADAGKRTADEFEKAIADGRWADALVFYKSLEALSSAPSGWTGPALLDALKKSWEQNGNHALAALASVPKSTPEDEAPAPGTVSSMIKGTVTVWVDRGLKVERGIGYADRVIGSGFFIDRRGYLVTNYHVIESEVNPEYEGFSRLFIKLPDDNDTRIPAKVIGWDPVFDLALLKTEVTPPAVFQLGASDTLAVGNRIYAIGSPAGLEQTLTSGIVSAQKRRLLSLGDVIQIDAPINHGNSGGPIVDEAGRVQAIVFAGIEPYEGLNFAIPVELLRIILPSLYAGGKIVHPWLGAWGKTAVDPLNPDASGVTVVYALPGGPCQNAGIPEGAVITSVNGARVRSLEELQYAVMRESSGTILRLGGRLPAPESLGEGAPSSSATGQSATLGSPPASASVSETTWFLSLGDRPAYPGETLYNRDRQDRLILPFFGLGLAQVGGGRRYSVASVVRGSVADESGFTVGDFVEVREFLVDKKQKAVAVSLLTKRKKSAYIDAYIGLSAYLDSPSYF